MGDNLDLEKMMNKVCISTLCLRSCLQTHTSMKRKEGSLCYLYQTQSITNTLHMGEEHLQGSSISFLALLKTTSKSRSSMASPTGVGWTFCHTSHQLEQQNLLKHEIM